MVAIVVLDALHGPTVDRLVAEGRLPAIASLRASGERVPLVGSAAYLEGSVHTTLHTGLEASAHGVYTPWQWSPPDQRIRLRDACRVPAAIWDRVGRAGGDSLLIDPYDSVAPRNLRGEGVRGWQFTNRVALRPWSTGSTRRRLSRRFGRARPGNEIFGRPATAELLRLRRVLLAGPGRIVEAVEALTRGRRFDLLWADFASLHLAGHQFLDVDGVARMEGVGEAERAALRGALEEIYVAGDRAIGALLERLPAGADLILAAPSTMTIETDRSDMLPAMLARVLGEGHGAGHETGRLQLWRVRGAMPRSLRDRIARLIPDRSALELTARLMTSGTDWTRTRAFAVPTDPGGGIQLNLRGRERDGIVEPEERDALEQELVEGLKSFVETDGAPAIEELMRPAELEPPGAASSLLPDLVVRWRQTPAAATASLRSPSFGTITRRGIGSGRSGNHTGGAWAILVPGRSHPRSTGRPARIVDIAASACSLLGVEAEDLAGEPLLAPSPGAV